jgi:SPP1 gp7 family putative phage head morphogenesis protein
MADEVLTTATQPDRADAYAQAWNGNGLFGPGVPMRPVRPADEQPRVFDFPPGVNLYLMPRAGYGLLAFDQLRNFANLCDEVRIVIESIKREIRALEWDFQPKNPDDKTDYGKEKDQLRAFWEKPDGNRDFDSWLNAVLEDMLVIDAVSLWQDVGDAGAVRSIDQIDGALIRPLLDARGKTPAPPLPAYVQTVKGQPWQWFTRDRFTYKPFNTNSQTPYGKSPTEFMVIRINQALRRKLSEASYWDETNVPEAMAGLPADWKPDDISKFQDYFDALLVGDLARLRRIKFMPSNGANLPIHEFRRPVETTALDEWMLKMACWAFGFNPAELGLTNGNGLGGKGFMEGQENAQYRLGFGPMVQYLQGLFAPIVAMQTKAPLVLKAINVGPQEDRVAEQQMLEAQLRNGVIDINVWRAKAGQAPIENAKPFMILNGVPVLLEEIFSPKDQGSGVWDRGAEFVNEPNDPNDETREPADKLSDAPPDEKEDGQPVEFIKLALDHWHEKVRRRVRDGKPANCEPPAMSKAAIPPSLQKRIRDQLVALATPSAPGIATVFQEIAGPKTFGLASHELLKAQQPTRGRREIEDDFRAWLDERAGELLDELDIESEADARALADDGSTFWDAFKAALLPGLVAYLITAAKHGAKETQTEKQFKLPGRLLAGVSWEEVNRDAQAWAERYAGQLIRGVTETAREDVRRALAAWAESGEPLDALTTRITQIVGDPGRARTIAQTESTQAFAEGNTQAWSAAGVEARRWFTVVDERVCPTCSALHDQVRPMGEPFEDNDGNTYDNPPAHPNCRCFLSPVLDDE